MVEPHGAQHLALLDTTAARSLLDRPTARAVLSRFGAVGDPGTGGPAAKRGPEQPKSPLTARVPKLGSFEVMNRTIEIAQSALARHTLAAYPPDVLIEVPRSTCRGLEFHRAVEVIEVGRALADQALDALEAGPEPERSPPALVKPGEPLSEIAACLRPETPVRGAKYYNCYATGIASSQLAAMSRQCQLGVVRKQSTRA